LDGVNKKAAEYSFKQVLLMTQIYRYLAISADLMVCLAHGSNDVANGISPLVVVLGSEGYSEWVPFLIGASGIAIGLLLYGQKVMETVGKKIVHLDF
jgi:PiT family inorganic phosphate transporter